MAEVEPQDHDGPAPTAAHAPADGPVGHEPADGPVGHEHADGHEHAGDCDEALAELYTFLDGELTDQKRADIKHHLDDCSPCLEVYDFEAELRLVIKHRCSDQVPDALRGRVAEQLASLEMERPGPDAHA